MDDIDMLLFMIENPTRRKILEALAREPHYPLQLSKELGISQQAVMKNLNALEKSGMVVNYQVSTSVGPTRTVYEPNSEFTLVVDMRNNMFSARIVETKTDENEMLPETGELQEMKERISELNRQIVELEEKRSELVRTKEGLIASAMSSLDGRYGYAYKCLLYNMLNEPEMSDEDISGKMRMDAGTVRQMTEDIARLMTMKERR